ncbi:P-loop containing nucleoside triphosphate hydrolase protein, partial [Aureobasidium melanogenum]
MDISSDAEEKLYQQQLVFAAQMRDGPACLKVEEEPFEQIEKRHEAATVAYAFAFMKGELSPEEKALWEQLDAQYQTAKAKQETLSKIKTEDTQDDSKRRRVSPSPLFVQQDRSDHDEGSDAADASTGSKRKRDETSKELSDNLRLSKMDESVVREILKRLATDAPADKKQKAVQDSARVLQAIRQLPSESTEYFEKGTWKVKGMFTPLKHHQLINLGWMKQQEANTKGSKGGILADEMGLGKTLSALASMVYGKTKFGREELKTNLVLVPKSLKDQWNNEAYEHTSKSTSKDNSGLGRIHAYSTETSVKTQLREFEDANLVIATYSELCRGFKNFSYPKNMSDAEKEKHFDKKYRPNLSALFRFKFRAIYLDEGHDIRNTKALRTMACQKLKSRYRWILTGTPMTNNPTDLYSVLTFVRDPQVLKLTQKEFNDMYKGPSKNEINVDWISSRLHSNMSRWTLQDDLFGRPLINIPKSVIKYLCVKLSVPEMIIYLVLHERLRLLAIEKMEDPDNTKTYQFVAGLLMVLRQMTGHVLLIRPIIFKYLTDDDMNIIYDAMDNNKVPEESELTRIMTGQAVGPAPVKLLGPNLNPNAQDYITALRKLQRSTTCTICKERTQDIRWAECFHAYCYNCLDKQMHHAAEHNLGEARCVPCGLPMGRLTEEDEDTEDESPRWRTESGKVIPSTKSSTVVELLRSWRDSVTGDPQAKAVVFTSFKDSHKLLAATFEEEKWEFTVLTADMSSAEREASVDEFKDNPDKFIMLATSGVGGIGLNLTVAKYLINYDHYFNEPTEKQVCGRIYRIGQEEQTTMVSITATGTVDEHVRDIKRRKAKNINGIMAATKKKSAKALLKLFDKAKEVKEIVGSHWRINTRTMSTAQKNSIYSQGELAKDLHSQYQIQIEDLNAEHKKKEIALLDKIQTAETRYQELESKYQKDFYNLKSKCTKHTSKPHHNENATAVPDNNEESAEDDTTKTDESPAQSAGSSMVDFDELCSICR